MLVNIDQAELGWLRDELKRYRDALGEIAAGDASEEQMVRWATLALGDGIVCEACGLEHEYDCDPEPFSESPTWREDNERYERMVNERD